MTIYSLKPFEDKGYLSEEEALKQIEAIPIPRDDSGNSKPVHAKPPALVPTNTNLESRIIQLDSLPADNGSKKTQDQWIAYWNGITDDRIFASMPDLYLTFKQLKEKLEHGSAKEKEFAQKVVEGLREDFEWPVKNNWLVSSTRIDYNPNNTNANITHYYGSNRRTPIAHSNIEIPVYLGEKVEKVLKENAGYNYLKTLFDTKDDKTIIISTLEFISDKKKDKVKIWTPPMQHNTYTTRAQYPARAAGLNYVDGEFLVGGDLNSDGRSRGVSLLSPR